MRDVDNGGAYGAYACADIANGWGQGQVFPSCWLLIQGAENKCPHKFTKEAKLVTLFRTKQGFVLIREGYTIKIDSLLAT